MTKSIAMKTLAKRAAMTLGVLGTVIAIAPVASAAPGTPAYQTQRAQTVIIAPRSAARTNATPRRTVQYVRISPVRTRVVIQRTAPARKVQKVVAPRIIVVTAPKQVKKVVSTTHRRR